MAGGRPPMYTKVEDMQEKIDEFFKLRDESGEPYTITGLALHLGFTTRQALINYEAKQEFVDAIKRAKTRVEEFCEMQLYKGAAAGPIFALKNHGWSDKQEITHSGNMQFNGVTITPPED